MNERGSTHHLPTTTGMSECDPKHTIFRLHPPSISAVAYSKLFFDGRSNTAPGGGDVLLGFDAGGRGGFCFVATMSQAAFAGLPYRGREF